MGREVGERARVGASSAWSTLSTQLDPTDPIGELSAQRVDQVPDEDDAGPEVAVRNTEGSKQEIIQGAPGRVLGLWLPHARRQLEGHLGPSFDNEIDKASGSDPVLQELDPSGLKQLAAGTIEAAAISFLDAEFQKEFHHPPE
jgi:hypothetical protein